MTEATETVSVLDTIRSERFALQVLVARELKDLGLPDQRFDIQASYLTFSPADLGIMLIWPISMPFQGTPTGVVQIGAKARNWQPQSRAIIVNARLMEPHKLRKEIRGWVRTQAAMVREAFEKRGGEWPRGWRRLQVRGSVTVDAMDVKRGTIATKGRVIGGRKR